MAAKKRRVRPRFTVDGGLSKLVNRIDDLEALVLENRRMLTVQFERIARLQVDVDRARAQLKKRDD